MKMYTVFLRSKFRYNLNEREMGIFEPMLMRGYGLCKLPRLGAIINVADVVNVEMENYPDQGRLLPEPDETTEDDAVWAMRQAKLDEIRAKLGAKIGLKPKKPEVNTNESLRNT